MSLSRPYDNVFEALEDDPSVAESLRIRTEMMIRLRDHIAQEGIGPEEVARDMGVTGDRIKDLMSGKIEHFTIDMLVNMLFRAGIHTELILRQAA